MEGYTLLRTIREMLNETSTGTFLNDRTSYEYVYSAVQDFNLKTHYMTNVQTINVIAGKSEYDLNADFVDMALMDSYNRKFIKCTSGGSDTFVFSRDYASVVMENSSTSSPIPVSYSIVDNSTQDTLEGTASIVSNGTGESYVYGASLDVTSAQAGDYIHCTTTGNDGVIVVNKAVAPPGYLTACIFSDGTPSNGTNTGAFIIVKQPRFKLVLSPTPSANSTITVPYIQRPDPVFSPYRAYRLPFNYMLPIVQFAAFLYKYKDRDPNYGDSFFKYYDGFVRKISAEMRRAIPGKQGIRVNLSKIDARSRSLGNYGR